MKTKNTDDAILSSAEVGRRYRTSKDEDERKQLFAIIPYALRIESLERILKGYQDVPPTADAAAQEASGHPHF